jgi:hypothetical protein
LIHKTIQKYLSVYAENEQNTITKPLKTYDFVIVIPICNESEHCLKKIFNKIKNESILVILVVNSVENHVSSKLWQTNNTLFINCLNNTFELNANNTFLEFNSSIDLFIIDRNSAGCQLPEKKGVGLARKLGADVGLKLYCLGAINYPWIFSTDADVELPDNYFNQVKFINHKDYSAIVNEFEHVSDTEELKSCQFLYDTKLRYFQAGIQFAGIEYDYIPLGSTLIVNVLSYAQVRGFPQRNAGEDFYILNKLAKVNTIYKSDGSIVKIKARFSDRVPFGTGPALMRIASSDEYLYYNPECFIYLKSWKDFLNSCWNHNQLKLVEPLDIKLKNLYKYLKCDEVFHQSKSQFTSKRLWSNFVHQWLDAFKTLKVVHYFDKQFTRLSLQQLLNNESFVKLKNQNLIKHLSKYE